MSSAPFARDDLITATRKVTDGDQVLRYVVYTRVVDCTRRFGGGWLLTVAYHAVGTPLPSERPFFEAGDERTERLAIDDGGYGLGPSAGWTVAARSCPPATVAAPTPERDA